MMFFLGTPTVITRGFPGWAEEALRKFPLYAVPANGSRNVRSHDIKVRSKVFRSIVINSQDCSLAAMNLDHAVNILAPVDRTKFIMQQDVIGYLSGTLFQI